jgi:protein-disulfide isomerase
MKLSPIKEFVIALILLLFVAATTVGQNGQVGAADSQGIVDDTAIAKVPEGMTRTQADEILQELKAIHQLLERQQPSVLSRQAAAPTTDKIQMTVASGSYSIGRDDAPITVVEFADYQCPFCRKFHSDTFVDLKKNYIDTGKVRFISRDLPLDFHPNAPGAALAARCAGEQNKFWEMRDKLLARDADLGSEALTKYATQIKLNMESFGACLNTKKYSPDIQKDVVDAGSVGIAGTPSFVVGKMVKDQINGVRIVGAVPYSTFETAINSQLSANPVGNVVGASRSDSAPGKPR